MDEDLTVPSRTKGAVEMSCSRMLCFKVMFAIIVLASATMVYADNNRQVVAGAGPSTEICKLFFGEFSKLDGQHDYRFFVMEESIKHKGGILNSDEYLFGRTGRPLTTQEKNLGKGQIFLAKVPITFAKGLEVNVPELGMESIEKIYTGKIVNWKEVGGPDAPILLVGREPGEALFLALKDEFPFFKTVSFDKVLKKDDAVVRFLTSPKGKHAIAFGAKPNFQEGNILPVKSFGSGVRVGLVYDLENAEHPVVQAAKDFADSKQWRESVQATEMLPVR